MTLSNEYYFAFEIHTLFEPGDHPETWEGLQYGVYSGHVCFYLQPHRGLCVGDMHTHSCRKVCVFVWRGKAMD